MPTRPESSITAKTRFCEPCCSEAFVKTDPTGLLLLTFFDKGTPGPEG